MSKPGDKMAYSYYPKPTKTPPKLETSMRRTQPKSFDGRKRVPESQNMHDLMREKDERLQYLTKKCHLMKVEKGGNIIFAELPQIPNVWVCYRRQAEREANQEKLNLDGY
jgi:leucine-rich repeat-containing protein 49